MELSATLVQRSKPVKLYWMDWRTQYRGYDSAGIAVYQKSDGKIHVRRDSGKLRNIRQELEKDLTSNNVGMVTLVGLPMDVNQNNAHPHKIMVVLWPFIMELSRII